jgi:hypothetical protein
MLGRIVTLGAGFFLLAAAVLKIHGLIANPNELDFMLPLLWQQILVIEVETFLGLWLITRLAANIARFTGVVFFGLLASISLYLALVGQSSCGCFGQVQIHPWFTFLIDLAFMTILFIFPYKSSSSTAQSSLLPFAWQSLVGTALFFVISMGFFLMLVEDPRATLARWKGDVIAVEPSILDLGAGMPGEWRELQVHLMNYDRTRGVQIVGGVSSCSCTAIDNLPATINVGGSRDLSVKFRFTGSPGRFLHQFFFYTDHPKAPVLLIRFTGTVKEPAG